MNPEISYDYCTIYLDARIPHANARTQGILVVSHFSADRIESEQILLDELGILADNYIAKMLSDGWQLCAVTEHNLYMRTYYLQRFK